MAARLQTRGDAVRCLPADAVDADSVTADRVVYLGALPLADRGVDDLTAVDECKALACEVPLKLLAACAHSSSASRVWLVTKGALPVEGSASSGARWQALSGAQAESLRSNLRRVGAVSSTSDRTLSTTASRKHC